jgi:hypothetical protein
MVLDGGTLGVCDVVADALRSKLALVGKSTG